MHQFGFIIRFHDYFLMFPTISLAYATQSVGHTRLFYWEVKFSKSKADLLPPSSSSNNNLCSSASTPPYAFTS